MKKTLILTGALIGALVLGVGAAAFISPKLAPIQAAQAVPIVAQAETVSNAEAGYQGYPTPVPGNNWPGNRMGGGMMQQGSNGYSQGNGMMGQDPNGYSQGYGMMEQGSNSYGQGYGMMGGGMMGQSPNGYSQGYGMMQQGSNGYGQGYGMMGNWGGTQQQGATPQNGWYGHGPGMMGQAPNGYSQGYGMMGGSRTTIDPNAHRISLDEALDAAKAYAGSNFDVLEIMEFDQNFYAIFVEPDTGRGAFEVLVDPVFGAVYPEPGPNMMWNLKYGRMGSYAGDNTISLQEAREYAQTSLDVNWENAKIEGEGASFYGYYTFDYAVDGEMVGMLSINGVDGQAFYHTWHGDFIQEEEHE